VLALSALLVLAFVPLLAAVTSLTRVTVQSIRESSARALSRAVANNVERARREYPMAELAARVSDEMRADGVRAIGLYDRVGRVELRVGDPEASAELPDAISIERETMRAVSTSRGSTIEVAVPSAGGAVVSVLATDEDARKVAPLLRLVGFYTAFFALALMFFTYVALTRLIVRPLDAISAAARRVAAGARDLDVPETGPAELVGLSRSLSEMTAKLLADEQRMRDQIDELERRAEKLREAGDRLVRSERLASVGRLSAGLAHEIGNPIAALLGLEELLLAGGLAPEEQHDFLLRIRAETERIHAVLRDLLDFARPASGGKVEEEKSGVVADAVNDVVALVRPQRSFRDVDLVVETEPDLPPVTLGHQRMMQVLLNLLMNAADAIARGGQVKLTARRHETCVRLSVSDNGAGIDPGVRERLFEPFVTTKEVGKGTGLGLAVCRGLVESARGSIFWDESHRPGARFVIDLPIAHPAQNAG
jgi:two-component system NtrC family sensor kinase